MRALITSSQPHRAALKSLGIIHRVGRRRRAGREAAPGRIPYHARVRYLRLLLNSVLAGGIAAAYLTILFLQLNPAVPLESGAVGPLLAILLLSYGIHLAVASYAAMVLWRMFAGAQLSPAWVSVRVLAWLGALVASGGAALMWLNLAGLRTSLTSTAAQEMALGAAIVTVCAIVFLLLALVRHSVRPQQWRLGAGLFLLALMTSMVAPLAIRGPAVEPPRATGAGSGDVRAFAAAGTGSRVLMLLVDGASLDYISPAAAGGRLPNLGRILDAGAVMHLATLRPTQPEPVWTAVATGKLPSGNGVRSSASYQVGGGGPAFDLLPDYCLAQALVHFGFLRETRHRSEAVRAGTLWDILGASGIDSAVVRWPLTYPARPIPGVLVSDRLHRSAVSSTLVDGYPALAPADLVERLHAGLSPSAVAPVIAGVAPEAPYPGIGSLAIDRFYAEVFHIVRETPGVRFMAMRYQGLDTVGHYYLRRAVPRAFGGVAGDEPPDSGRVLEQYYRYVDEEVGRAVDLLDSDDLLLVVSAFGMEPVRMPKRLLERLLGNPELSGTHERAPDGFLMAYGAAVRAGRLPRASVLDVAPTVLYFFGLPIGRDMDGFARTDVFSRAFTDERPLTFIPSYER